MINEQNERVRNNKPDVDVPVMYNCSMEIDDFHGKKNFTFYLGYIGNEIERGYDLPYNKMIIDYDDVPEARDYARGAVDEMFLLHEVRELETYLSKYQHVRFSYKVATLPINADTFPMDWKYTGGERNLFEFVKYDAEIPLGFDVQCYFDAFDSMWETE